MQLLICGDPHGKFAHIIEAVLEHRPSATILLGDNTPDQPLDEALREIAGKTELFWIPGNHDTDTVEYHDRQFGSKLADRNLHGRIIDIAGLRVAGLGGVFRTKLWNDTSKAAASPEGYIRSLKREERWRDGLPLRHRSTIFRSQIDKLARPHWNCRRASSKGLAFGRVTSSGWRSRKPNERGGARYYRPGCTRIALEESRAGDCVCGSRPSFRTIGIRRRF
jgi:hypothetical protein